MDVYVILHQTIIKKYEKSRVFQKDAYISIDFLEKKAEIIKLKNIKI